MTAGTGGAIIGPIASRGGAAVAAAPTIAGRVLSTTGSVESTDDLETDYI